MLIIFIRNRYKRSQHTQSCQPLKMKKSTGLVEKSILAKLSVLMKMTCTHTQVNVLRCISFWLIAVFEHVAQ